MEEKKIEEQSEVKVEENQTESQNGNVGKSIKSFFKKVKGALEKLDKKLDEAMENDPYANKEQPKDDKDKKEE